MKIQRVSIENFRIIRRFEYDCVDGLNVFVGVNGAGKTTFLNALSYLLSWLLARVRNPKGNGTVIREEDITLGEDFCRLEIVLDNGVTWKQYLKKKTNRTVDANTSDYSQLNVFANELAEQSEHTLPVVMFYGVERAVTAIPSRLKHTSQNPISLYSDALSSMVDFRSFFEWYRERLDIENDDYRSNPTEFQEDKLLKCIRTALRKALPEYGELRVHRSPQYFYMQKDGQTLRMDSLSDGEKCYITLIADIARRFAVAYRDMDDPLQGRGVVMIDEVDLHLHPRWQMQVLPMLKVIFPNCQFFITTHSPQVVSGINPLAGDKQIVISNGEFVEASMCNYGKKTDDILLGDFGMPNVRTQAVQDRLDEVWRLLRDKRYDGEEYRLLVEWLRHHMDPADEELGRIRLQEMLLQKQAQ